MEDWYEVPEYRSAIIDECGYVVEWCDEWNDGEIEIYLEQHPEYRCRCICIN